MSDPEPEPTYPSAEELMNQLGPDRMDFMRSMMEPEYKPGEMEEDDKPYHSPLSRELEAKFQKWVKDNKISFDDSPTSDYDMRGFFGSMEKRDPNAQTAVSKFDGRIHFPDTYKTPYHKTFSDQSIYATPEMDAPHWEGDRLIDNEGNVIADETPKN
jgi:hypothetical protein